MGQLRIERAPVDICALVRRVVGEVRPTLDDRTMELRCPDAPLVVSGDELRLEQVLQNLIHNAFKYSQAPEPISVTVTQQADRVCVAVQDQGMGIPSAALPHLGERFYRADNAAARQISGMGIGLYVVKEIVTLHGGAVTVESTEGAGSTFSVYLPQDASSGMRDQGLMARQQ
jgi:signal transduction histidine kinase